MNQKQNTLHSRPNSKKSCTLIHQKSLASGALLSFQSYTIPYYVLIIVISVTISTVSFAQTTTKNYKVKVAGVTVGHFSATQIVNKNEVSYQIKSEVDINLWLYKLKTTFMSNVAYSGDFVSYSRVDMKSNKGDFFTETKKNQKGYLIRGENHDGCFQKQLNEMIGLSVASLYFHEPDNASQAYAEFYGDFMKIKKIKPGVYQGTIANNEDLFYYSEGNLVKTVKKNGFKDLEFVYIDTISKPSR